MKSQIQHISQDEQYQQLPNVTLPQVVADSASSPLDYIALVPWGHIRFILDKG